MRSDSPVPGGNDLSERALGALLLAPAAILLLVVVVYPIATLFWNSLHTADPSNAQAPELWAGLGNYARAFDDAHIAHAALRKRARDRESNHTTADDYNVSTLIFVSHGPKPYS